ncbi:MAG: hypothetical protein IKJ35_06050 [Clostridia bacterium]|nr:hypothetical protein [Clostridia bacterium]
MTQAKIRGFASYRQQYMEQMKRDLEICMSLQALSFCADYYRTQAKRDPFIEELRMIDRFARPLPSSFSEMAPTQLLTNCDFITETYADMMKKRHELHPDAKEPCSFEETLKMATFYLERAGKEPSLKNTLFLLEDLKNGDHSHLPSNFIGSPSSRTGIRAIQKGNVLPEIGDLFVLLRAGEDDAERHKKSTARFLNTPAATAPIKAIRTVGRRGLLYEMLQIAPSARIDLNRLSLMGESVSPTLLTDAYEGDYLIRISPRSYSEFFNAASAFGVHFIAFATIPEGGRLLFTEGNEQLFALDSAFLRALLPVSRISVKIDGEENAPAAPILHTPRTPAVCDYLSVPQEEQAQVVENHGVFYAAASCTPESGFFRAALETLLTAVLTVAAIGGDHREQRAAVTLSLPQKQTDDRHLGEAVASILGIYRLQAEIGLPLCATNLFSDEALAHPQVSAFSMTKKAKIGGQLTTEGNQIYCITPTRRENGLPDFDALRKLLLHLNLLHERGAVKSARVICRERITEAIQKMSPPTLTCLYDDFVVAIDEELDLAILIESAEELPFGRVGSVVRRLSPDPTPEAEPLPPTVSLLALQDANVILLSEKNDLSAEVLADRCHEMGAKDIPVFPQDEDYENTLSRALLNAQTMIVCTDTPIPHTPKVVFALETFQRAGGRILLVGNGIRQENLSGFALPNGIPSEILDQICKIENDCKNI